MTIDQLKPRVREALEKCPVTWEKKDDRGLRWAARLTSAETGHWTLSQTHFHHEFSYSLDGWDEVAQAIIEKHWREECERRRVQFRRIANMWEWRMYGAGEEDGKHGPFGGFLDCLADAILATQPRLPACPICDTVLAVDGSRQCAGWCPGEKEDKP